MLFEDAYYLINTKPRFKLTINDKRITITGKGNTEFAIHHEDKGFFYFCASKGKRCDSRVKTAFEELRKVIAGGNWDREYLEPPKHNYYGSPTWTGD